MKRHKHIIQLTTIFITIVLFFNIGFTINKIYKISNMNSTNIYINDNLGSLENKLTYDEIKSLKPLFSVKLYLSDKRMSKNKLKLSTLESTLSKIIDKKLNTYTIKYELDGNKLEETDSEKSFYKNNTLYKLKKTLNQEDYKSVTKLCKSYADGDYASLDSLTNIINKYYFSNTDIITTYLTQSSNLELESVFNINKNLDLDYSSIKGITPDKVTNLENEKYNLIWDDIKYILPNSDLKNFDKLFFATDGEYNELASVTPNNFNGSEWIITIDPNDVKSSDNNLFYETILHEYFHYLSLNNKQVSYTDDYNTRNYCEEGMVTKTNSYLNDFYNQFWKNIIDDKLVDKNNYYFYERHKDSFIDEYASTDPSEDIAETFAYFVLNDKPTGDSIRDKKIKFFYQYDELVSLKKELQTKINSL